MFEGTFLENITMDRQVDPHELDKILRIVGLDEYLNAQPKGLHTRVDPGGRRLPRSVMQRALIARALACKPRLLLIEDPLVSFKQEERERVIDYIMDPDKPWCRKVRAGPKRRQRSSG
jgi:ABC-type multidrug transport system fused ATPase/permease subunit